MNEPLGYVSVEEIASRNQAEREIRKALSRAAAIAAWCPSVYEGGKGYGDILYRMLQREFAHRGLPIKPPRRKKGEGWQSVRLVAIERSNGRCANCASDERLTVDHKVPRSKGGSDALTNLQVLCLKCNSAKGAMTQKEWERHYSKDSRILEEEMRRKA